MSVYENLESSKQFACRVIADHARSTAFAIADGILPGNEGRNYVLRKIMRRAIYHGREHLGLHEAFFYKVCDEVVTRFSGAFPELETQRDFISKMVRLEEERFGSTLSVGLKRLNEMLERMDFSGDNRSSVFDLPTAEFAELYDTFGVPVDLIYVAYVQFLKTRLDGYAIDDPDSSFPDSESFAEQIGIELKRLQVNSGIGKTERKSEIRPIYHDVLAKHGPSKFVGYDVTQFEGATVKAIIREDVAPLTLEEGEEGGVVLDVTPFYAESGGQVGDSGLLTTDRGTVLKVLDTFAPLPNLIIHKVKVEKGSIRPAGDEFIDELTKDGYVRSGPDTQVISAQVDVEKRDATRRNHTATHLVHAALKEVLGTHVKQAGSVVAPNYLRFDFAHYQPMSAAELAEVEDLVNRYILQNEPVTTNMMALEDAMRSGAVAMFGEKYGADVRVLSVGDGSFSMELCGGTHVRATGDIGSFKITSDEAIASGVRRIRAVTGFDAFNRFRDDERLIDASLAALNTQRDNLPNAIARLQEELKRTRKEFDDLKLKAAMGGGSAANGDSDEVKEIAGVKVLAKVVDGLDAGATRQLSDTLLARLKSGVVVIGRKDDGKVGLIVRVSDDLTAKVKAGNIIREIAPIVGGKGGGKPDMAEGGGTDPDKLNDAIDAAYGVIEGMLG